MSIDRGREIGELILYEAGPDDASAVVELLHAAFREYFGVLDPPSSVHAETVESVREKLKTVHWVLAERQGTRVGCVMYENRGEYIYLGRLSVPPAFRGRGIGSALLDCVEARAIAEGVTRVRLGVRLVLKENRAMYERRGYRVIGYETHAGYAEPTYVTCEKILRHT